MRNLGAIIMFILAGGVFFVYTKPAYDQSRTTQTEVASYDAALTKAAELQQRKQELLTKYNAMSPEDLDRLQKMLPDHVDNVRLILDFDNLAKQYGMTMQDVNVSTPASDESSQNVISASAIGAAKFDSVTIDFSTSGSYETFQKFLQAIQTSLRIVDLVSLKVTPSQDNSTGAYRYDVSLRTYWLR